MPFHITTSTRTVAGSSTISDDIKDTLFEIIMDKLWYQSNGMLYFCGNTLFLHQLDGQVSYKELDHKSIYTLALLSHSTNGLIIHLVLNYFNHQVNLFALQVPVFGHLPKYLQLDYWTHHSFGSQLQFGLLDSSFI